MTKNLLAKFKLVILFIVLFTSSCKKESSNTVPVISTNAIEDITTSSVKSGGEITSDGGEAILSRGVCWSLAEAPTISDNKTSNGTGIGAFTSIVEDLSPNTTYYLRAYATNSIGVGYGSTMSFKTDAGELPIVTTSPLTNATTSSTDCGGNITSDGGTEISARGVCWSLTPNPTIANSKTTDGSGLGSFESQISGLTINSTYYFRAYATNSVGTAYGNELRLTTVEDGVYIVGAGTPLAQLDSKGKMNNGINEVGQALRPGMFEKYMTVKSGNEGFNIVEKLGATETVYGPNVMTPTVIDGSNDQIYANIQLGSYSVTNNKFTVPSSNLYHIILDKRRATVAIIPINHWGIIGGTTTFGWSAEIELPLKGSFNNSSMEFEKTNIRMTQGEFKFRYDNGWNVRLSGDSVKVNANLGASIDNLVPGGNNLIFSESQRGNYTISLKWTIENGIKATLTKTGEIAAFDYSNIKLGIIGNCYKLADGTTQAYWDVNWGGTNIDPLAGTIAPVVTNTTTYTWTWDHVKIESPTVNDMRFLFRQDDNWSGKTYNYTNLITTGSASSNFSKSDESHFKCNVAGEYKFVLVINALTENYTLTITGY